MKAKNVIKLVKTIMPKQRKKASTFDGLWGTDGLSIRKQIERAHNIRLS